MNTSLDSLRKAKGNVLVLTAMSLLVLLGMAALAIDLSHAETNKTKLQNLADALALSAAISLNKQQTSTTYSTPETYAQNFALTSTLPDFKNASGNTEVTLASTDFTFTFAKDWSTNPANWKGASQITGAKFVRVTMNSLNVPTWFAPVLGSSFKSMAVSASAVAGTAPIAPCSNVLPIIACAANGNTDTNCSDGECYGYATNTAFCFKTSSGGGSKCPDLTAPYQGLGSGNFGWMDVGTGGKSVNDCAAGDPSCQNQFCANYAASGTLQSKTGNVASIDQGFDTRFDIYQGSYKSSSLYPPDRIVGGNPTSTLLDNSTRSDGSKLNPAAPSVTIQPIGGQATVTPTNLYINHYKPLIDSNAASDVKTADLPYQDGRRVLAVPFVNCAAASGNGTVTIPSSAVLGWGCVFITEPMPNGSPTSIFAEVIDNSKNACIAAGKLISNNNTGIYQVILYKDPFSGQS